MIIIDVYFCIQVTSIVASYGMVTDIVEPLIGNILNDCQKSSLSLKLVSFNLQTKQPVWATGLVRI